MGIRRRIYLYGNSVILGTLGMRLRRLPQYEVISLLTLVEPQELNSLAPVIIIFDLEITRPETFFPLLESYPGLLLIGISSDTNMVKTWSGRQLHDLSTQDLMEVINEH